MGIELPPQSTIAIPRVSFEDRSNTKESRVFIGAPDFRVFVWGIEISTDVFSVSTTLAMNEAVSTATINIVNDNLKWILPTAVAAIGLDGIPDELSELPFDIEALSTGTNTKNPNTRFITPLQFAKKKRDNLLARFSAEGRTTKEGKTTPANLIIDKIQNSHIFPFLPGRPIIQMADPVRIFFKNPWKFNTPLDPNGPNLPDAEEWFFAFTGYIASVTEDFDAQTNRSVLRVTCEDIRRLLRYMRTSTNPNVFDINVVQDPRQELITSTSIIGAGSRESAAQEIERQLSTRGGDAILVTGNAALSAGMSIVRTDSSPGVMELLLFGDTDQLSTSNKPSDSKQSISGVLGFKQGGKIVVQLPVDDGFESALSPTLDLIYPILAPETVTLYGEDWALGDSTVNPDSPESNHLWVILPDKEHFVELTEPFDWSMRIDFFSEWRSRLDIINEFVKNIDCIWYATPKGDIVLEFPNYDCHPHLHADPWKSILTIHNEFTRFSSTEDDRNLKTVTIGVGSALEGINTAPGLPFLAVEPFKNWELIARYGVREQRSNRPFHYESEFIPNALPALTQMWQELANADAYRLEGLETLPNFRAVPGRPYWFKYRNQIGFAETVTHQIVWGELAQTVYGLKYIRHFDAIQKDWQKLSGNYGWHWKPVEDSLAKKDVHTNTTFVRSKQTRNRIPFGTSDQMEQIHQGIRQLEINQGSPLLTNDQHAEMDRITQLMDDTQKPLSPAERRDLIKEYGSLVHAAGGIPNV